MTQLEVLRPSLFSMRDLFRSYYPPTSNDFATIWQEGIFSLDANVLLHIYRYSPKTRARFFEILEKLGDRIWITHQAAYEYQENRLGVISNQAKAYEKIQVHLDEFLGSKVIDKLKGRVGEFSRHSHVDVNQVAAIVERGLRSTLTEVEEYLNQAKSEQTDLIANDDLRETLSDLLLGKIGTGYQKEELEKLHLEGEKRFIAKIPPGFKDDKNKESPRKYGDFVLWSQLLEYASSKQKPLVFVIDEKKEDWWLEHNGRKLSPRRELIDEMYTRANVLFWMYSSSQFMDHAENFLNLTHEQEIIEEAEEVSLTNGLSQVEETETQSGKSRSKASASRASRPARSFQEAFGAVENLQTYLQKNPEVMKAISAVPSIASSRMAEIQTYMRENPEVMRAISLAPSVLDAKIAAIASDLNSIPMNNLLNVQMLAAFPELFREPQSGSKPDDEDAPPESEDSNDAEA